MTPPICAVAGCEMRAKARGWCGKHWTRWSKYGSPTGTCKPTLDQRVDARIQRGAPDECWLWTGKIGTFGYGYVWIGPKNQETSAHRYVYLRDVGPIPDGFHVDHTCHNDSGCLGGACTHRRCANPSHLEAVPPAVNVQRSHLGFARRTHCPKGHPYSAENTYLTKSRKGRICRACHLARMRRRNRSQSGFWERGAAS